MIKATRSSSRLTERLWLADGAMGTMLQDAGLPLGACPEAWNLSRPEAVRDIHRRYLDAGSDLILTNTFGGSRLKLRRLGLEDRVDEINRAGVRLAKSAAADALVAASIGPTGELPEPYGETAIETFFEVFSEQIDAVVTEGVDLIWIETMSDLSEALTALRAAVARCDLPVVVTMTFDRGPQGYRTMMGVSPEEAARALADAGAAYVGANCGFGCEDIVEVIKAMSAVVPAGSLAAKPNAGLPQLERGNVRYPETPEEMARRVPELIEAGARFIGGCCGTTPAHIRMIKQEMERSRS